MIEHYNLIVVLYWLLMIPIATFILAHVTGYFTGEYPATALKALGILLLLAGIVYFSWDISSYFFVVMMQEPGIGYVLPRGYSYWIWMREPFALKWQILGFAPFIRFLPIFFALIMGGIAQVFLWKVPYPVGAVIFLAQVFLNLVAMVLLSYVFRLGIVLYERVAHEEGGARPSVKEFPKGTDPRAPPESLSHLAHRVRNLGPEQGSIWRRLEDDWDAVNGHLHTLYAVFNPITRHLPLPAQDFLNSGGLVLVLLGLAGIGVFWPRVDRRRKRYVEHRKIHPPARRDSRIDLAFVGDALTDLGPHQVTVRGVPARLRLVIMAPAAAGSPGLHKELLAPLLNSIRTGLAEVAQFDSPRVEAWNSQRARENFAETLAKRVVFPEPAGAPSRWVLLCGQTSVASTLVHVGLGFCASATGTNRSSEIPRGQWSEVVGLRKVSEDERVPWHK